MEVIERNNEALSVEIPLERIPQSYYDEMSILIDGLEKQSEFGEDEEAYAAAKIMISNFVYLIYERLQLQTTRQLNYNLLRKWATKNNTLAVYLLQKQFRDFNLENFQKWVQPSTPIMRMGMYNRSNADTKDTYH
jgi:hypothetical protein